MLNIPFENFLTEVLCECIANDEDMPSWLTLEDYVSSFERGLTGVQHYDMFVRGYWF